MPITYNRDYILKALSKFNVSEDDVDVIIADCPELDGQATLNVTACKQAIYKSMSTILPVANISETGYSVSWNVEAMKVWYKALCKELGKPNALRPAIRDRSNHW